MFISSAKCRYFVYLIASHNLLINTLQSRALIIIVLLLLLLIIIIIIIIIIRFYIILEDILTVASC
jgi:hypothetical protein